MIDLSRFAGPAPSKVSLCLAVALGGLALGLASAEAEELVPASWTEDLNQLSIEDLANLEVISVSRRPEPVRQAPAAIYVITNEEIRRAGARTLPEALRLAPNLQVAALDSGNYGITARGFNHETGTANKLLVLIDGRSVYTPVHSGVFWDAQNVMLDDVDRIEVISGPGGTLWGANAVNGVINVVTRSASETQGTLLYGGAGTNFSTLAARQGVSLNSDADLRLYGMGFRRGPSELASGADGLDEWENLQGGARLDWSRGDDTFTLQGDAYYGEIDDIPGQLRRNVVNGGNLLGHWSHRFADDSAFELQTYYDISRRVLTSGIVSTVETADIDGQYDFSLGERNQVVVGGGARMHWDRFTPGPATARTDPAERTLRLWHVYVQDTIAATDALDLTLGLKLEDNSYTGMEYLPNARLSWRLSDQSFAWAAISRAVRTPSRFDRDLFSPVIAGGPDFVSEELVAYEAGYRAEPTANTRFSVSLYYNDYDELRTIEADPVTVFPLTIENGMSGEAYGAEIWGDYVVTDWWRLSGGINLLHKELELDAGSSDIFGTSFAGNDPDYQVFARSLMNLSPDFDLDIGVRAVDDLPAPAIPAYVAVDARLAWRATESAEIAISGYNLFDDAHVEFANPAIGARAIPRSFLVTTRWRL